MVRETGVQSQLESYQRLKKWYLMPPCLTLSVIRLGSRVKWFREWISALLYTSGVVAVEKRAFWSSSTTVANFTYFIYFENLLVLDRKTWNHKVTWDHMEIICIREKFLLWYNCCPKNSYATTTQKWTYNECNSLTSSHKINPDGLTCC